MRRHLTAAAVVAASTLTALTMPAVATAATDCPTGIDGTCYVSKKTKHAIPTTAGTYRYTASCKPGHTAVAGHIKLRDRDATYANFDATTRVTTSTQGINTITGDWYARITVTAGRKPIRLVVRALCVDSAPGSLTWLR